MRKIPGTIRALVRFLGGRFQRIQAGAAAERFVEGAAEMAEAVVADGDGGFGDVALAGAQKFGGAFHANLTNVLLNRHAGFLGEKPAQIKRAAANLFAEFFERGRFFEIFAKDEAGAFDAFARGALGARAEKFSASGTEEK